MTRNLPATLPKSMLGVWAHPDDEAYLSAALMAAVRAAGRRVVVATATRGELGTDDPNTWPARRLAPVRERELAASLACLDVNEHHWLGHRDGTLADVDPTLGALQIATLIEEVCPDVVVTFGPDGMTGHPDHKAISHWVTSACETLPRPPRLWQATLTPEFHRTWRAQNIAAGLWPDAAAAPSTDPTELVWSMPNSARLRDQKSAALRAHASQTGPLVSLVGESTYRAWWSCEYFIDASPTRRATRTAP